VLRLAPWPEEIKIYAEHVHWFWVHRDLLKVTKCSVAVGHLHNRDSEIGDIRYERMRRRREYLDLSNQMLGIKGRRVIMAQGRALADVRPRSRPPAEPKPRRLLSLDAFSEVFADLKGKRVGYVPNPGNVGDAMIAAATAELLAKFKIQWRPWQEGKDADLDVLAYGGGGSMGGNYYSAFELRQKMLASELPVVILPQSFMGPEEGNYSKVFVRERDSLVHAPGAVLAPDLALGLAWRNDEPVVMERALFLRNDVEKLFDDPRSLGDPARMVDTWYDYLRLAGRCGWIITDRLHFAIAGLLCGRRVTLLPNSYHKNRSMYDTWLKDLGCEWSDTVPEDTQP
jgi:hypothetical protein